MAARSKTRPRRATARLGNGLLVGYYAEWKKSTFPPSAIEWSALTHVAEAFVLPEADGGLSNVASFADDALVAAAHAHGVKVVASVGGARGDFYRSVVAAGPRGRTVAALATLCKDHGYDGIDIDWEFPDSSTIAAWESLLDDLRTALDAIGPGLTLSSTIAPTPPSSDLPTVAALSKLDWVEVMAYRYSGPSSDEVGYLAPLADPPDAGGEGSVTDTIRHLVTDRGIPASKLLLGIPFYGLEFEDGPPGTPIASPSHVIEMPGTSVLPLVGTSGWTRSWDSVAGAPSLTDGKLFASHVRRHAVDRRSSARLRARERARRGDGLAHERRGAAGRRSRSSSTRRGVADPVPLAPMPAEERSSKSSPGVAPRRPNGRCRRRRATGRPGHREKCQGRWLGA